MGRRPATWQVIRARVAAIEAAQRAAEAEQAAHRKKISKGPPPGSGISRRAWKDWHLYGWVARPGPKRPLCDNAACRLGAACQAMKELGLAGDGSPLPRRARPMCRARNRQGKPCAVRVEPGKPRCRFHGGLSTGPRTAKGERRVSRRRSGDDGRCGHCGRELPRSLTPAAVSRTGVRVQSTHEVALVQPNRRPGEPLPAPPALATSMPRQPVGCHLRSVDGCCSRSRPLCPGDVPVSAFVLC
jgi:hypothetical protein